MRSYFISIEQDSKGALTEKKFKNCFSVLGVLPLRLFSLEVKTSKTPIFAPFLKLRLSSPTSCQRPVLWAQGAILGMMIATKGVLLGIQGPILPALFGTRKA